MPDRTDTHTAAAATYIAPRSLRVVANPDTDLYHRPGKSFTNAPIFTQTTPAGAFTAVLRTHVPGGLPAQYQHAGAVLLTQRAGVERWGGALRESVVVTRGPGGSDWSVGGVWPSDDGGGVTFWNRVKRTEEGTVTVEMSADGAEGSWRLVRKTYEWGLEPVQFGCMCAAPSGAPAFEVVFSELSVTAGC
ncbi:hypothetical protein DFJ73DRAFT_862365 [Zopfochytrium polystomum]|nr:hypothetical protein DFJ73DRAFT_862365 [Zopfochytrium polystomum]